MRGAPWLLVVLTLGCVQPVRLEARDVPVESGLLVPFSADGSRRWDFGDGSPSREGAEVVHAFQRAGRYTVRGFVRDSVREQVQLTVTPRAVFHLVPPDVQWAVIARGLEELPPAVDFAERLLGANSLQAWLERYPLQGWALDQATAGAQWVDPREGLAFFGWEDSDEVRLSVVGVTDGERSMAALEAWLVERGWARVSAVQGLHRLELDARALDLFVDRGALYAVDSALTRRQPGLQQRVAAASALGLEADGPTATALDALPSGGLVVWGRAPAGLSWKRMAGTLRLSGDEAHFEARLLAPAPLWTVPTLGGRRLLSRAPELPVVAGVATLDPRQLAALLLGAPGTPRRTTLDQELLADGANLDLALAALAGNFDATGYPDIEGFVRSTLEAGGRPSPRGTLLLEVGVSNAAPVEALLDALVHRWSLDVVKSRERQVRMWKGRFGDRPLDIALTDQGLFVKAGASLSDRDPTDLVKSLGERFEGAFGPGHLSLVVDVGQLRRELLLPRLISGVDPRGALTAQAMAATLLDRLTQLDLAVLDLRPVPEGGALQVIVRLRPPTSP